MNKYIDSEIILQRKVGPLIYVYIMIIIVIMLSLIIVFIILHYKTYYNVKGIVTSDENHYYIKIYVPLDNIKYLINNNIIKINNKEYEYKIISLDSEYFTDNTITYQIVMIEVNIPSIYKFNNLNLELKFLKEDKRIIDYILKK
ncbi:MAG: hypothetical protein ACI4VL_02645 [Bacilli bacterium]